MPDDLENNIELLVHASAPTSKQDDDRYRAQALACLDFRPAKRRVIASVSLLGRRRRAPEEPVDARARFRESRRVGDHTPAPGQGVPKTLARKAGGARSVPIGDPKSSSSFNGVDTPGIVSAPPSEKLEPKASFSSPHIPTATKIDEETDQGDSDACYDTSFFDSWEEPPDTIPDSLEPPPQQLQAVGSLAEPLFTEAEADQSSSEKCLFPALSGVSFAYHQQPPNASSLTLIEPLRPAEHESIARSEPSITSLHSQLPNSIAEFNPLCPLTTLIDGPYSFLSPVPTTSSNPPLITENLRAIWQVGEVRSRYQALKISQSRDLRERERGSWRMDMAGWVSASHKIHFWTSLKEHVTLGRLGWVNVFLDEEESGNLVKIFCFGVTVEHVWAVLYILSDRRMAGAAWLDAADNEVIKF